MVTFIRVTHSVPDTSHIFIETPVGNFYHGSDFKFDDTPWDGIKTDYEKIQSVASKGVLCLLSDCLGAEKQGQSPTEKDIMQSFLEEAQKCKGKLIITTYSSHIARLNQILAVSQKTGRRVCFVGRSLVKATEAGKKLGYLKLGNNIEVPLDELKNIPDNKVTLIVAGSQGQENSALSRIANGEHKDVRITPRDTIIFSADPIPGNEVIINELIDTLAKKDVRVLYSAISRNFHVSGHGYQEELRKLIQLTKPKNLLPIGGGFRQMAAYRTLAESMGFQRKNILLLEDGQEVLFSQDKTQFGRIIPVKNVYLDQISGEELDSFVLRDRQKLSEAGVVIILCEIDSTNGQLAQEPDIITRGFAHDNETRLLKKLHQDVRNGLSVRKGRVTNWIYLRKLIGDIAEKRIYRELRVRPLVLPIVIEV